MLGKIGRSSEEGSRGQRWTDKLLYGNPEVADSRRKPEKHQQVLGLTQQRTVMEPQDTQPMAYTGSSAASLMLVSAEKIQKQIVHTSVKWSKRSFKPSCSEY